MRKILDLIKDTDNHKLIGVFFILGILALFTTLYPEYRKGESAPAGEAKSVDTYIPAGFVLVPLDLVNTESLNSFIGDHGVVDLFQSVDGIKGKKIASKIKIIRAPLNPQLYAALIREASAQELLTHPGPFLAIVQNKTQKEGGLDTHKTKTSTVYYQN